MQNLTYCDFSPREMVLKNQMMAHWTSFARFGDPNTGAVAGSVHWPAVAVQSGGGSSSEPAIVEIRRLRFAVKATDGEDTGLMNGVHDDRCDFWDRFNGGPPRDSTLVV